MNGDCTVNTHDLSIFSEDWLESSGYINPAEPDHAGLVVHYDFNETAGTTLADSSGNEYTGTFFTGVDQNPADISGRIDPGRLDNSFHFSARIAHAGISMPADVFTENSISQEITVAVWIKNAHPEEAPDSGAFMWEFRQWDGVSTQAGPRVLAVEASDWGNSYGLWDDSRSIWYEHEWQLHTEWRHYAFVRDADSLTMYVDGLSKAEGYSSGSPMSAPGLLNIGISADRAPGNTSGLHDGFTGNMDDWKIYSYALSQQEILGLAETGPVHAALRSPADLYRDDEEIVNLKDYAVLAEHWLESPLEP